MSRICVEHHAQAARRGRHPDGTLLRRCALAAAHRRGFTAGQRLRLPAPAGDWRGYGYDATGRRFSPLTQINAGNVSQLRPVWKYGIASGAGDANPANRLASTTEAVPIMVGGILYTPTIQHNIVALEPETGEELWKYDLGKASGTLRGVTYWQGDRDAPPQIFVGTSDGALIALDAKTGKLVPGFGNKGMVDLRPGVTEKFPDAPYHISTPGVIYRNLIIAGAQGKEDDPDGPAMDVRAWDLHTGKLVWTFHTIPHPGEPGYETWPKDNWIKAGSPAAWGARPSMKSAAWCFCPSANPPRNITAARGTGRICIRLRSWRSMPTPEKCAGISS